MAKRMGRIAILLPLFLSVGCGGLGNDSPPPAIEAARIAAEPDAMDEEHGHRPGSFGGRIVTIGQEEYHAEVVVQDDGTLRLYMLGQDETRMEEVEEQDLLAYVRPDGGRQSTVLVLKPEPQTGDAEGMTSQFAGTLPEQLRDRDLEISIPNLRIADDRFRLGFTHQAAVAEPGMPMPMGVGDEEARRLYLTPAGLYTEADIEANGRVTAAEKYRGFRARHDRNPKPGDRICPITGTKANPKCTWIIGGKPYWFCCPPCIDEFLVSAKESPETIVGPEEYVQQ